jgi:hypothetical protein
LSVYTSTTSDIFPPSVNIISGIYSISGDTMTITFLQQNTALGKSLRKDSLLIQNSNAGFPMASTFVVSDSSVQSIEKIIPMLRVSSISVSTKLKSDFSKRIQESFSIPKKIVKPSLR